MSTADDANELFTHSEHSDARVVHLKPRAIDSSRWTEARTKLKQLFLESSTGFVLDCRELPSRGCETIAPLLYEMLVAGRRRVPRAELCVVGRVEQTTGSPTAFLLPARFNTLEEAFDTLNFRPAASTHLRASRSFVSSEPVSWDRPRFASQQTQIGQIGLAILVITLSAGAVAYSANTSFSQAMPLRRHRDLERDEQIVIQGAVRRREGTTEVADSGAVVLIWPIARPDSKFKLTAAELFGERTGPIDSGLVIARCLADGKYVVYLNQLRQANTAYYLLALSQDGRQPEGATPPDLSVLTDYFEFPQALVGDRQFALQEVFLDAHVTKDHNFVLVEKVASD